MHHSGQLVMLYSAFAISTRPRSFQISSCTQVSRKPACIRKPDRDLAGPTALRASPESSSTIPLVSNQHVIFYFCSAGLMEIDRVHQYTSS
ncbi:putative Xaa-Pro aminopeptidase P [Dorcoceras hygrometricum]|uniref:Putative Xaa-Pro aminopeptidase P n=1 Tax=Dorcoceras hygrometricum TaxID=472368 RepID=A0A2Z7B2J7_9LAMI|nr:putative Xaa-Pro aminopeptidase P [Dorcoceras hygrometricum]